MAYYKRRYGKKKTYTKPSSRTITRAPRPMYNRLSPNLIKKLPHFFKFHVDKGAIAFDDASNSAVAGFTFKLSDISNYTELTALFDSYKLNKIVIMFFPTFNSIVNPLTNASQILPTITSAIDPDDATAPSTQNELREYDTCRFTSGPRMHKRIIYPKLRGILYNGGGDGYKKERPCYIDTAQAGVEHYGLKVWMDNGGNSSTGQTPYSCRVEAIYYLTCKNTK